MEINSAELQELHDHLQSSRSSSVRLYLITRHFKPDVPKSRKMLNKYAFKTSKIDLDKELQAFFKKLLVSQIEEALSKKDMEMCEYSVIDDDLPNKIYTYALNNALSFADVINNQLSKTSSIVPINSLKEIKDNLWAYCIKIDVDGSPAYSFRKAQKRQVGTDENDKSFRQAVRCAFSTKDAKLEILKKETISFDEKIDCIYLNSSFFVFKKGCFESIVGLDDEFKENAENMISDLKKSNLIEGIEYLEQEISINKTLLKRLAAAARAGNYKELDASKIRKMKTLAQKFNETFKTKGEKVLFENEKDINLFIRLLNDYYKRGELTGNFYGSNSGKLLKAV